MDGDVISTFDPPPPSTEILAVESTAVEVPVAHSPPPSDGDGDGDDDDHHLADVRAKIVKQVEYYFSDENLPNDNFLLKQVKRDKEGYVSISLIASFRKMKRLTKDGSLIVDALKESTQLVVCSDGKKVKRLHPLPLHPLPSNEDRDPMFCFVVVANLPEDHSVQNIQKIFGAAGSIKSISVKDPHVAKDSANKKANSVHQKANKLVNGKMYALVEYETEEAAEKAVAILNDETDWRYGLRVQLLLKRTVGHKARKGSNSEKGSNAQLPVPTKGEDKNHSIEQHDDVVDVDDEVGEHTSKERNRRKGRNRTKGRKYSVSIPVGHGTAVIGEPSKPPPGPRMPDGTRGFTMGRGRPPISNHV